MLTRLQIFLLLCLLLFTGKCGSKRGGVFGGSRGSSSSRGGVFGGRTSSGSRGGGIFGSSAHRGGVFGSSANRGGVFGGSHTGLRPSSRGSSRDWFRGSNYGRPKSSM